MQLHGSSIPRLSPSVADIRGADTRHLLALTRPLVERMARQPHRRHARDRHPVAPAGLQVLPGLGRIPPGPPSVSFFAAVDQAPPVFDPPPPEELSRIIHPEIRDELLTMIQEDQQVRKAGG